ncbi:MAG: GntR family transcriptional regulator [Pseudomonadota bacterium]|nr:GntR family transcriptional regulator [Pseudomonadota bacterium]
MVQTTAVNKVVKTKPLKFQVADSLRQAILSGKFADTERITEVSVSELLGVSRTPVREALVQLAQEGILRVRKGGGYVLFSPSKEELLEVFEMRELLEVFAIQKVVKTTDDDHLADLKMKIEQLKAANQAFSLNEFIILNLEFRQILYRTLPNAIAKKMIEELGNYMHYIGRATLGSPEVREIVISGYEKICHEVELRNVGKAISAVTSQLNAAREALLANNELAPLN